MAEKYVLIEVVERDVSEPMFFDTEQEATNEMVSLFKEAMDPEGDTLEEIRQWIFDEFGDDGYDMMLTSTYGYGEKHGQNFDWKIFKVSV